MAMVGGGSDHVVILRNRKLELELKRKQAEIKQLKKDFEASKQKNVQTVMELQQQVRGNHRDLIAGDHVQY